MRSIRTTVLSLALALAASGLPITATAATPSPEAVLADAIRAAGGTPALAALGYLRLSVREEETLASGRTKVRTWSAVVRVGDTLSPARLELGPELVLVDSPETPWALVRGRIDRRPGTPLKARGTVHMKLVPLLVPFSLRTAGIRLQRVERATIEGRDMLVLRWTVPPGFFAHATMNTEWWAAFDPEGSRLELAGFSPPSDLRSVLPEDVRYRYLRWARVGGVLLPTHVVVEGVAPDGTATGHVRVTKIAYERVEAPDPTLFINPETLERLDQGEPTGGG